ncbi:MAG: hypothetical protein OXB86_07005 [Bdellovibrionales bacterium]|nr:hypothetical protein [Bdellovibrionales bacterium]
MATNKTEFFRYQWLKGSYTPEKTSLFFWSLPKRAIPRAVDRNRLRRWGRENLKTLQMTGHFTVLFLPAGKGFYKTLCRREFDDVFFNLFEKIQKTHR